MMRSLFLVGLGCFFLTIGGNELHRHAVAIREVRDVSTPLIADITPLEQRLAFLEHQSDISSFHASLRTGSPEEYVHVFLLPEETDLERTLTLFEQIGATLEQASTLANLQQIVFGKSEQQNGHTVQPMTLNMSLHDTGLQELLLLVDIAGSRTIGDVLSAEEKDILVQRSEEESPAGIVPLSEFFATDLLDYALEPKPYQERLLRSFSSDLFHEAFRSTIESTAMRDRTHLLSGPIGQALDTQELWPLQFMTLENLELQQGSAAGWQNVEMTIMLHTQEK